MWDDYGGFGGVNYGGYQGFDWSPVASPSWDLGGSSYAFPSSMDGNSGYGAPSSPSVGFSSTEYPGNGFSFGSSGAGDGNSAAITPASFNAATPSASSMPNLGLSSGGISPVGADSGGVGFSVPGAPGADLTSAFSTNPFLSPELLDDWKQRTQTAGGDVPLPQSRPWQADATDNPGGDVYTGPGAGGQPSQQTQQKPPTTFTPPGQQTQTPSQQTTVGAMPQVGGAKVGATVPIGGEGDNKTIFDKLTEGVTKSVTSNPLGILAAGLGLTAAMGQGNKKPEGYGDLKAQANALAADSANLRSYLTSGTLPPGLKTAVDNATAAAKARLIQNYASRNPGISVDPTKNSALAQELQAIDEQAAVSTSQIATQLMQTGMSAANISTQIYQNLMNIDIAAQQRSGQAIANFAAALSGAPKSINVKL